MDLTIAIVLILQYVLMSTAQLSAPSQAAWLFLGISITTNALIVQLIYTFSMISLLLAYYARIRRLSLTAIFGLQRLPLWKILLLALGVYVIAIILLGSMQRPYFSYLEKLGIETEALQESAKTFVATPNWDFRILFFLTAVVAAPALEELVFRGFLYPVIKKYTDVWFALIFVSLLFGAIHQHLSSLPLLAMLGLFLNLAYEKTGCLWVPIMIHAIFNSAALINLSSLQ